MRQERGACWKTKVMDSPSQLIVEQREGVSVIDFRNATVLDAKHVEAVNLELFDLVENQNHRRLVLNLGSVQLISSQTLGVFLNLRKKLDELEGTMVISGIDPKLYRVFKVTNLTGVFEFFEDTDKAIESLK